MVFYKLNELGITKKCLTKKRSLSNRKKPVKQVMRVEDYFSLWTCKNDLKELFMFCLGREKNIEKMLEYSDSTQ